MDLGTDTFETEDVVDVGEVIEKADLSPKVESGIILSKPSKRFFLENKDLGIISPWILMNKNAETINKKIKLIFQRDPSHFESLEKVKSSELTEDWAELDELEDFWLDLLELYEDIFIYIILISLDKY